MHRGLGDNVVIKPIKGGVEVRAQNGTLLKLLPALPECIAYEEKMQIERMKRRNGTHVKSPFDGWLDNAGIVNININFSISNQFRL